jgi:hypothetical protein
VGATGVTVSVAAPVTPLADAVIVVDPAPTDVARPPDAIVATVETEDVQAAVAVKSCVELLLYVPVALYCWAWPAIIDIVAGVTVSDLRVGEEELPLLHPDSSATSKAVQTNRTVFIGGSHLQIRIYDAGTSDNQGPVAEQSLLPWAVCFGFGKGTASQLAEKAGMYAPPWKSGPSGPRNPSIIN